MITEAQYTQAMGREPHQDDLERSNCIKAGEIGHMQCGWCDTHNKPMFCCPRACWHPFKRETYGR